MPAPKAADEAQAEQLPATSKREADAMLGRATLALNGVQALKEEIEGFIKGMVRRMEKVEAAGSSGLSVQEIADSVHQAMAPIVEKANAKMLELTGKVAALEETGAVRSNGILDRLDKIQSQVDVADRRLSTIGAIQPEDHQFNWDRVASQVNALVDSRLALNGFPEGADGSVLSSVPRVHAKVLELMRQVRELGKDGQAAKEMGGYSFRSIDAAINAVGTAMRDVGLTMETRVVRREYVTEESRNREGRTIVWTSCRLVMRYTFVDPVDGSQHSFEMAGEARASDDKATSKAESMALKYGLIQALMIPVVGTADGDGDSPQVFREQPQEAPASPAGQPPQQPAREQQVDRSARARDALTALRGVHNLPMEARQSSLASIRQQIEKENLGGVEIDGATLRGHGSAVAATLVQGGEPGTGF